MQGATGFGFLTTNNFNIMKDYFIKNHLVIALSSLLLLINAKPIYQTIKVAAPLAVEEIGGFQTVTLDVDTEDGVVAQADFETMLEPVDRHFFRNNLSANTHHTHDANKYRTTINELGGWDMTCGTGVIHQSFFSMDSFLFNFQTMGSGPLGGDMQFLANDDIYFVASNEARISLEHNRLQLGCDNGNFQILSLTTNSNPSRLLSIDGGTKVVEETPITANVWTPTLGDRVNCSDPNPYNATWFFFGPVIMVSGQIDIVVDGTGPTSFEIDVPATNSGFDNQYDAHGTGVTSDFEPVRIYAQAAEDNIIFEWEADAAGTVSLSYQFTYHYF
jgi:hypothetical protein